MGRGVSTWSCDLKSECGGGKLGNTWPDFYALKSWVLCVTECSKSKPQAASRGGSWSRRPLSFLWACTAV